MIYKEYKPPVRVGTGYDVHRLVKGRKLILGGVDIEYDYGLDGHSDADVLVHAIMDAIVGALAAGDIGKLFPDTDEQYKGISSLELLRRVAEGLAGTEYRLGNVDSTVVAQKPKLSPYTEQMVENIARTLRVDPSQISVKATTEEGLGFTGTGEGIAAQAVCSLILKPQMDPPLGPAEF